jgi:molybdopterin-containing oxidoreductase family iron-sulfur binding subunit
MNHENSVDNAARSCKGAKEEFVQIGLPAYWKSLKELETGPRSSTEFPGGLPGDQTPQANTRRDFLSLMGFTVAAAGLTGCRAPVQYAVPQVTGSDQLVPGVSNWYATTCGGCPSACSLLVKQRDGRPIKIEGNDQSALFGPGTCATGQATVLSLYDGERLRGPVWKGKPAKWAEIDRRVLDSLDAAGKTERAVVLLSGTLTGPSTLEIVANWAKRHANFRHVVYDAVSLSALRAANAESFGRKAIPHYFFDKARVIVGMEADFLGTWLSPVEFARQYAGSRRSGQESSLHIQYESGLSVTGSKADVRVPVAPSEMGAVAVALLRRIARMAGMADVPAGPESFREPEKLDAVAEQLWHHRGESLVVSGVADKSVQVVVNALNAFLGNIGKTVDLARPSLQRSGDDQAMAELVEQMNRGEIHTLLLYGVNPGYDYPDAGRFLKGFEKVALSVSFSDRRDETSSRTDAICPDHHFLEAWGDAEPVDSHFSLAQPTIAPLFDTRAAQESLLKWIGNDSDYYVWLRAYWREHMFPRQKELAGFDTFWDRSLQAGVVALAPKAGLDVPAFHGGPEYHSSWNAAASTIMDAHKQALAARREDGCEVLLYEGVPMRDGRNANNPWLQELPDPITKVTWGNFAAVAPGLAKKLGVTDGDVISLQTETAQVQIPVVVQPGQESRTIAVALGYGRKLVGKAGQDVGVNAWPLTAIREGVRRYSAANAVVKTTGRRETLASTQTHFSMEGRPIALETTLQDLHNEPEAEAESMPTLWAERPMGAHWWGMAIDMNACTGCSACVVACQAENNVPVVGRDQVQRTRIMHWIRLDHYYIGSEDNPRSVHQPMMCQHCGNAPCETVCPVLATTTSSEGLNTQVYNRCVGTRYCANNCPYKVRRFNFYNYTQNSDFDFNMESPLGRMVLNPDVVVRTRGVMEKCSLCVQRIQLAKNGALQGKRELIDGDIMTACQQACPTQAIVFGDLKDSGSRVSKLHRDRRFYRVLEDLGTRPNVGYLKKLRYPLETA